jgi:membrane-bound lytic murein transglycosylase D
LSGFRRSTIPFILIALFLMLGCAGSTRRHQGAAIPPPESERVAETPDGSPPTFAAGEEELLPPVLTAEPEEAPLDPTEVLIRDADELYLRGLESLQEGDEPAALTAFDRAVATYLLAPRPLATEPMVREQFEDLVESIHRAQVEARQSGPETLVSTEDLKSITAYLSPKQATREEDKVREKSATVVFDVPVEINDRVVAFIDAFSGPRKRLFEPGMVRSGRYVPMIRRIFREEGVPQDLCYMAHIESAFKPNAYSRARAKGLFQFIASTGRNYGLRADWWVDMRSDPELSARAAARYLTVLHEIYGDWYLALAEYNGGSRVRRAWNRSGRKADFWDLARGRSLRIETRNYVPQILAAIVLHKSPEKYGLSTQREKPMVYDTVELSESVDLRVAARLAGTTLDDMIALNLGLRRLATPPDYKAYPLRLPVDTAGQFRVELAKLPESERLPWYHHRVRRGETLSTIAARYGASVYAIQKANSLRNPHRISVGQDLMIPGSAVRVAALDSSGAPPRAADGTRQVHRVRRGDNLYSIARRYRTNVASLTAWNSITDPTMIRPGQRLVVYPGTRASASAAASGPTGARAGGAGREREETSYRVRRGDTLYSIARRHSVSVRAIQGWNDLGRSSLIHPGQILKLYR